MDRTTVVDPRAAAAVLCLGGAEDTDLECARRGFAERLGRSEIEFGAAERIDVAAERIDITAERIDVAAEGYDITAEGIHIAAEGIHIAAERIEVAAEWIDVPAEGIDVAAHERRRRGHSPGNLETRDVESGADLVEANGGPIVEAVQRVAEGLALPNSPSKLTLEVCPTSRRSPSPFQLKATFQSFNADNDGAQTRAICVAGVATSSLNFTPLQSLVAWVAPNSCASALFAGAYRRGR